MSRFDEIRDKHDRLGASHDDVAWLISEVERLRWFEDMYEAMQKQNEPLCLWCRQTATYDQSGHDEGCEYIKHKAKE